MDHSRDTSKSRDRRESADSGESPKAWAGGSDADSGQFLDGDDLFSDGDPLAGLAKRELSAPIEQKVLLRLIADTCRELEVRASSPADSEFSPVRSLHDRRILLVDDSAEVFKAFVPALLAATNGAAIFLRHREETSAVLVKQILAFKPELVLLDGELSGGLRGWDVAQALSKRNQKLPIIGFSSDPGYESKFLAHSAMGFIAKRIQAVPATIAEVGVQVGLLLELGL